LMPCLLPPFRLFNLLFFCDHTPFLSFCLPALRLEVCDALSECS
jgi:hypothetical protein